MNQLPTLRFPVRKTVLICFFVAALTATPGCAPEKSKNYAPVSGKITIDGEPLIGAKVVFVPVKYRDENQDVVPYSYGVTDENGNYKLKMKNNIMGAAIGKHIVFITTAKSEMVSLDEDEKEKPDSKGKNKSKQDQAEDTKPKVETKSNKVERKDQNPDTGKDDKSEGKASKDDGLLLIEQLKSDSNKDEIIAKRRFLKEESILSQYNSRTELEFTVKAGTSNQANFSLKRFPE